MAEERDLEKCNFRNFRSLVTLILTLDLVEVTGVHIRSRSTHTPNYIEIGKLFVDGRKCVLTDGRTDPSSSLLPGDDQKIEPRIYVLFVLKLYNEYRVTKTKR